MSIKADIHSAMLEIERLRSENEALKQRAEKAERERDELINVFENELAKEAKKYIELSNDVVSGVYKNQTPEGSIYNEKIYVETRLKDITDPLFVSSKEQMQKRDTKQQIKGVESVIIGLRNKLETPCDKGSELLIESLIDDLERHCKQLRAQLDIEVIDG